MILEKFIESLGENMLKKPMRIYSFSANSVVGTIVNGKVTVPDSMMKREYISIDIQPNARLKGSSDVYVIMIQ